MLEQMRLELQKEGYEVSFLSVNKADAATNQQPLIDHCAFPLFQDTEAVNAWALIGGHKDDFLIYSATGKLVDYLPNGGDRVTNLSLHDGYDTVKAAIIAAVTAKP